MATGLIAMRRDERFLMSSDNPVLHSQVLADFAKFAEIYSLSRELLHLLMVKSYFFCEHIEMCESQHLCSRFSDHIVVQDPQILLKLHFVHHLGSPRGRCCKLPVEEPHMK